MTEETAQQILQTLRDYDLSNKIACVFICIWILCMVCYGIYEYVMYKKVKQWKEEYKATLNEEQLKAIENYRKIKL